MTAGRARSPEAAADDPVRGSSKMTDRSRRQAAIGRLGAILSAGGIVAAFLVGVGSPDVVQAGGVTVTISKNFQPSPVEIYAGETVTWVNRDIVNHFIVSDLPGVIPYSGPILPGKSYRFVFTKVGTWGYHDFNYDAMTGTVIVKAAPAPTPTPRPKATPRPTPRPTARPAATPVVRATPRPTAKITAKATSKPAAKPTAKPTASTPATSAASPSASDSSLAGGAVGSLDGGAGPSGTDTGLPTDSSGGPSALGLALVLLALVGAAFAGGFLIATRRRKPTSPGFAASGASAAAASAVAVDAASPGPVVDPAAAGPPVLVPSGSSSPIQMPYEVDEDAPLQNAPPPKNHPG
jgi:plastocyanin